MPAMTMVFRVSDEAMMADLAEGQDIEFVADRVEGKLTVTEMSESRDVGARARAPSRRPWAVPRGWQRFSRRPSRTRRRSHGG